MHCNSETDRVGSRFLTTFGMTTNDKEDDKMNILIKNAYLLQGDVVEEKDILIEGNIIKEIGEIPKGIKIDKNIDGKNKLVMPGLINSHTHIAMSLFRNYADDLLFWPWLTERIQPKEESLKAEDVYWGSMLSIVELIKGGVTAFNDMYMFMDEVAKAVEETGIRGHLSIGVASGNEDEKIKKTIDFYDNWHNKADGRIKILVGPHAVYSTTEDFLQKLIQLGHDKNMMMHTHIQESRKEVADCIKEHGKTPIEYLNDLGLFDLPTIAAHCVHTSEKDREILAKKNVSVANNPGSNLKLANGFAQVDEMVKAGVNVALGTDGSASNNNLNMFEEINLAALVNKGVNEDALSIPATLAVKMATLNGAKALGMDKEIGSIEEGKKADLIMLDIDKPHYYPRFNLVASLAYSAQSSDVETVIVDGKILMEDYQLTNIDLEKVIFHAERCAKNLA